MIKRLFDLIFSLAGIIVLSPLMLLVALLIKLDSKGTVFFRQERIGQGFKPFIIFKFRTMMDDVSKKGPLVTYGGDLRITKIGRFLRKTKIDELPQLLNVLKGDMSFVGPRPEVGKYVEVFSNDYQQVLEVKPGITDFASLQYCNEEEELKKYSDPEEGYLAEILPAKIVLYKKYLRERGFFTDIRLIIQTLSRLTSNYNSGVKSRPDSMGTKLDGLRPSPERRLVNRQNIRISSDFRAPVLKHALVEQRKNMSH